MLEALVVLLSKTEEPAGKEAVSRLAASDAALLAILLPPSSIAEATLAMSPIMLSVSDERSLACSGEAARAGLLHMLSAGTYLTRVSN
jgi:hypothetical protein